MGEGNIQKHKPPVCLPPTPLAFQSYPCTPWKNAEPLGFWGESMKATRTCALSLVLKQHLPVFGDWYSLRALSRRGWSFSFLKTYQYVCILQSCSSWGALCTHVPQVLVLASCPMYQASTGQTGPQHTQQASTPIWVLHIHGPSLSGHQMREVRQAELDLGSPNLNYSVRACLTVTLFPRD